jgi:hypothetical protein
MQRIVCGANVLMATLVAGLLPVSALAQSDHQLGASVFSPGTSLSPKNDPYLGLYNKSLANLATKYIRDMAAASKGCNQAAYDRARTTFNNLVEEADRSEDQAATRYIAADSAIVGFPSEHPSPGFMSQLFLFSRSIPVPKNLIERRAAASTAYTDAYLDARHLRDDLVLLPAYSGCLRQTSGSPAGPAQKHLAPLKK